MEERNCRHKRVAIRVVWWIFLLLIFGYDEILTRNNDGCTTIIPIAAAMDPIISTKVTDIVHQLQVWQKENRKKSNMTIPSQQRPFVTITYAQSIDGYMAPYNSMENDEDETDAESMSARTTSNYPLSGEESFLLTHALRSIHDGIMIGGRTLWIDNPRLTNRLWGTRTNSSFASQSQPQPIILDPKLRYIRKLGTIRNVKNPIVCCSHKSSVLNFNDHLNTTNDIRLLPCQCYDDGMFNMSDVLSQLYQCYGIRHLMVEGGAQTLSALFTSNVVDAIIITIVSKVLCFGIRPIYDFTTNKRKSCLQQMDLLLSSSRFILLGNDVTLIARLVGNTTRF
jgi:riboflavin biosynthesis pyrimidine reductase